MCVQKTVRHRLQLDDNHTHYYSKPLAPNIPTKPCPSNIYKVGVNIYKVGMPCGCGLIFNDTPRFFSFLLLPTYRIYANIRLAQETTNRVGM